MNNPKHTNISHDARLTWLDPEAPLPTTLEEALDGTDLGLLEEGGETFSLSKTVENYRARNNKKAIVRSDVRDGEITLNVTAIEDTPTVRALYWGTVEVDGVIQVDANAAIEGRFVYDTFDTQIGYVKATRYVLEGLVTPNGDVAYNPDTMVGYPLTINVRSFSIINSVVIETPEA